MQRTICFNVKLAVTQNPAEQTLQGFLYHYYLL